MLDKFFNPHACFTLPEAAADSERMNLQTRGYHEHRDPVGHGNKGAKGCPFYQISSDVK
jgi:hypothetical protein